MISFVKWFVRFDWRRGWLQLVYIGEIFACWNVRLLLIFDIKELWKVRIMEELICKKVDV